MTPNKANVFLVVLLFHSGYAGQHATWHYGEEDQWPEKCHNGRKQSPIALSNSISQEKEFPQFVFRNYNKIYPVTTKNNGHSAEVRLYVAEQPTVVGGGLPEVYILDHLHFHWQSEHTVNNFRFPLELHLVHYANQYHNLSHALNYKNGVAVLSVLFDLSPDDDMEFQPLITVIDKLHDTVDKTEQLQMRIDEYLPRDTAGFYRYNGSLTTPDCTEGIIWTIFTNTLPISSTQVKSFALLHTEQHKELPKNYRPLQSLNGRNVFLKVSPIRNLAPKMSTFSTTLFMSSFIVSFAFFSF